MSTYTFTHTNDVTPITVTVTYDDTKDPSFDAVLGVIIQFLEGVSFSHSVIGKYINHELAA